MDGMRKKDPTRISALGFFYFFHFSWILSLNVT